ncbi:Succinate--CoA ligase subunit beta [Penicillium verhagenii]|nr:Succinate--CoA ligase subunit beta [Penicillium verhagenii]
MRSIFAKLEFYMAFVSQHTTIRLPQVFDAWVEYRNKYLDIETGTCFIVMSYIDGWLLDGVWPGLRDTSRDDIQQQLYHSICELRQTESDYPGLIDGGASQGAFFTDYDAGPFASKEELEEWFDERLAVNRKIVDSHGRAWLIDWAYGGMYTAYFETPTIVRHDKEPYFAHLLDLLGDKEYSEATGPVSRPLIVSNGELLLRNPAEEELAKAYSQWADILLCSLTHLFGEIGALTMQNEGRIRFDIPVPNGHVVTNAEEAQTVVTTIHAPSILKAQVLAGGRGKGKCSSDGKGGVRMVNTQVTPNKPLKKPPSPIQEPPNLTSNPRPRPSEAFDSASKMLGYYLTTKQTPPEGLLVKKLYIYKAVDVAQELYVALTFDRTRGMPVLLISDRGGVNIEDNVSELQKYWFHMPHGIGPEITAYIQAQLGFSDAEMGTLSHILRQMVELFEEKDATLLELNPLVRTPDGDFVCLDAKFSFDNSARFRQQGLFSLEERSEEEEVEFEAAELGLSYVRLDGDIGNIVNGAGLAMATNDLIGLCGGKCANFLDVGGGATKETLSKAFEILNNDARIRGILVNIYGGIVRCDMIAESIIAAAAEMGGFKVPVVVRLQGTNSDKGLKLIANSNAGNLTVEPDFETAAQTIVQLAELESR